MTAGGTKRGDVTRTAVLWGIAALGVVLAGWRLQLPISNDGVQYLSGAENLLAGRGYATSILFFDEHYRFTTIPAPQTVWPPGYPALVAVVAGLGGGGIQLEESARLVGRLSYVLLLPIVFGLAYRVTGQRTLAGVVALWTLATSELWLYTAGPNSELPFLVLSLAALAAVPLESARPARWLGPGLLGALAATTRYAGVFLIIALALTALGTVWLRFRNTRRFHPGPILWFGLGASPFALVALRNWLLVDALIGGNAKRVSQPLGGLLESTVKALADLLFGVSLTDFRAGGWHTAAAGLGLVGAGILAALVLTSRSAHTVPAIGRVRDPATHALWLYPAVYLPALLWTASRTHLTFGGRYLLPVLPVIALIIVRLGLPTARQEAPSAGQPGRWRLAVIGVLSVFVAQAATLGRRWEARGTPFLIDPLVTAYASDHLGQREPVLAVGNGQQVGYLLRRPTAAVPHQWFTASPWDETMVRDVMSRYGIRTLIIHVGGGDADYGPFLDSVISGALPSWAEEVASSPRIRILDSR